MNEQIAHRELARDVGIPHGECGQVADDRRIPVDLLLIDQQAERRRGKHFRVRRDAEQRPAVDRRRLA
jgi:hypothetical protein